METGQIKVQGHLCSKVSDIRTYSEGPIYFLQSRKPNEEYKEIIIVKKCQLWEKDPTLEKYLNFYVEITGNFVQIDKFMASWVMTYQDVNHERLSDAEERDKLTLTAHVEGEEFIGYGLIFCKYHLHGTMSEGPFYYLQQTNYKEVLIYKKTAQPWQRDKFLDNLLYKRVRLEGKRVPVEGIPSWAWYGVNYEHVEEVLGFPRSLCDVDDWDEFITKS